MLRYKLSNPSTGPVWTCLQHSTLLHGEFLLPSLAEAVFCISPGLRVDLGTLLSAGFMRGGGCGLFRTSVIQEATRIFSNSSWLQRCVVCLAMISQVRWRKVEMALIWGLFLSGSSQWIADLKSGWQVFACLQPCWLNWLMCSRAIPLFLCCKHSHQGTGDKAAFVLTLNAENKRQWHHSSSIATCIGSYRQCSVCVYSTWQQISSPSYKHTQTHTLTHDHAYRYTCRCGRDCWIVNTSFDICVFVSA